MYTKLLASKVPCTCTTCRGFNIHWYTCNHSNRADFNMAGYCFAIPKLKAKLGRLDYQSITVHPPGTFTKMALKPDQGLPSWLGTSLLVSRKN